MSSLSSDLGAVIFLALSICVLIFALQSKRAQRMRRGAEVAVRLVSRAHKTAATGILLLVLSFYPGGGLGLWREIIVGLGLGAVAGIVLARHRTKIWKADLDHEGRLQPEVRQWWQSWWAILIFIVIVSPIVLSVSGRSFTTQGGMAEAFSVLYSALCGAFIAVGLYTGRWAKQKEQQGYRPLVILIRKV